MTSKATTYRLDAQTYEALTVLGGVLRRPLNQLVNEAVREYVVRRSREVEVDLHATLERLRANRRVDPNYEAAIDDYVDAEARLSADPAEGKSISKAINKTMNKSVRAAKTAAKTAKSIARGSVRARVLDQLHR